MNDAQLLSVVAGVVAALAFFTLMAWNERDFWKKAARRQTLLTYVALANAQKYEHKYDSIIATVKGDEDKASYHVEQYAVYAVKAEKLLEEIHELN